MEFRKMLRFKQQLTEEECIKILKNEPRGVLALIGDGGYPYTVPFDFLYEDGKIYFHCGKQGHKIDAIRGCDKASFCVIDKGEKAPDEWWYVFKSVIAFGRIRIIEDFDETIEKVRLLSNKYSPTTDYTEQEIKESANHVLCLEMSIEHMTGKRVNEK